MRVGPGERYPILWVFQKRYIPLEIIEEFGHWRKIRDYDGAEGWVHKSLLTGKRYGMVRAERVILYEASDVQSSAVVRLARGTLGRVLECAQDWCYVHVGGYKGWTPKTTLWGVYSHEVWE